MMHKRIIACALAGALCLPSGAFARAIAVQAVADPPVSLVTTTDHDAIELSKSISAQPNEDGEYTITLEAYTTGVVTMGEVGNPVDVLLVLDQSSSMLADFAGNETDVDEARIQYALKNAAKHFIETVHENAVSCGLNHRVGIMWFATTADSVKDFGEVQTQRGYRKMDDAIDALTYDIEGGTFPHAGMDLAEFMFIRDANTYQGTETRDKRIVFFSDGQPNMKEYGDDAIEIARRLKKGSEDLDKIEIYTIGTFAGADPSVITGAATANVGETWTVANKDEDPTVGNRFMNYLSSNSSNAENMGLYCKEITDKDGEKIGDMCKITSAYKWKNKGYYMSANDAVSLDAMFDSVSHSITVDAPSLDETGMLKDFLSPYFVFPDDFDSSTITLQTAACLGADENGAYQWAEPTLLTAQSGVAATYQADQKCISVTGFDYADNVVTDISKSDTTADYGAKLIVSFPVKAKEGFLGGNKVVSNTSDSGIYTQDDELLESFDVPNADVVLPAVPLTAQNQSIYLGNTVRSGDCIALEGNPFDGINNAYVDADVVLCCDENANGSIEEAERANAQTVSVLAGSSVTQLSFDGVFAPETHTQYLAEVTLTPIYQGTKEARSDVAADFAIYVKVPSVTVQDVWVDYGVPVALSEHCMNAVEWQFLAPEPVDAPEPTASEPTVTLMYAPTLEGDVYHAIAEKTFTVNGVQWLSTDGTQTLITYPFAQGNAQVFTVHLNLCNLTITKTVDAQQFARYPQTFCFTAQQLEQPFNVVMNAAELATGSCSKSIKGLYAGQEITVAEDGAWAWRYAADGVPTRVLYQNLNAEGTAPLISTSPMPVGELELAVENTLTQTKWLTTEDTVANRFDGREDAA